jgi:hypothetical protein
MAKQKRNQRKDRKEDKKAGNKNTGNKKKK